MEPKKYSPKIIAHQGFGSQHSENMLLALKTAAAAQVEMIEIDVHETRDGRFIVHHDDAIHRDWPAWHDLTYAQVQQFANHAERAPLLSDCLKAIGSIPVDIEIKSYVDTRRLVKKLKTSSLSPGSIISSGDFHLLRHLHISGVEIPLVLILAISNRRSIRQNVMNALLFMAPQRLPSFIKGVAVYHHLAHKRFIVNLQRNGIKVFVWTIDKKKEMKKFISLGVNGIITNHPDRLYKLLQANANI